MSGANSKVIPREELSAFQRWQFNTLLDADADADADAEESSARDIGDSQNQELVKNVVASEGDPVIPDVTEMPPSELLSYPTAQEIEAIEHQAQEDGYQAGLTAGKLAAEADIGRLRALLCDLEDACKGAEATLAEDVVELALVVARQMVRAELHADKTLLLPAIREAIAGLPLIKEPARLVLNPDDLKAVSGLLVGELSADYWCFIPDPTLPSGSCRIEASNSAVNLMLAERWDNILQVLGKNNREDLAWDKGSLPTVDGEK